MPKTIITALLADRGAATDHKDMARVLFALTCTAVALLAVFAGSASAATTAELLAPASVCHSQSDATLTAGTQQTAMLCMVNYARRQSGRAALTTSALLRDAAVRKARDIVLCNEFSHIACGLPFDRRIRDVGYAYRTATENIAWGTGSSATARSIMTDWLSSSGHRANILSASFRDQGIAVIKGTFQGYTGAQVWVEELAAPASGPAPRRSGHRDR
jgi:uncharacterized protein YkwD